MSLLLIRHPATQQDPLCPPSKWDLSAAGQAQVAALVQAPLWRDVTHVYTSTHGKTRIVGEAIHTAHGIPTTALPGLDEARREAWLDPATFAAAQQAFFSGGSIPASWEPAAEALARFRAALDDLLSRHDPAESLAVVSHASVLTLYTAYLSGAAPDMDRWRGIGFMAVMQVDRATLRPLTPFVAVE